jgi:glycosyltransferase involved in cell wall biosynthesis
MSTPGVMPEIPTSVEQPDIRVNPRPGAPEAPELPEPKLADMAKATDLAASRVPLVARVPWPKTDRPLHIAMIGWARMSSQGREGSGYNLSKSELARGLVLSGHRVSAIASGMTYRLRGLSVGPAHIAHRETWGGVECYELRNSANVSPAAWNFRNMRNEIAEPVSTALVIKWLDEIGADVVHIHSQEGYGLDLIGAIEASGRPVCVTLHNYWFVCPQVDLLYKEREVCVDYEGGVRCETCLEGTDVAKFRRQRALGQTLEHRLGLYPADVVRKMVYGSKGFLKALARGRFSRGYVSGPMHPDTLNDPELARGFEDVAAEPDGDTRAHHQLTLAHGEEPKEYLPAHWDTNERVLANGYPLSASTATTANGTINGVNAGHARPNAPTPPHRVSLNIYGERRSAGVAALARASMVTPPSDFLRSVHVAIGVPEEKTRWVRLGQPHFDQLNRRVRRSPMYDVRPWDPSSARRPLRFAFFGTTRPNKGLEVLMRAIPLLEARVRSRCQFIVRAQGWDFSFRKRMADYPEVSVWGGYDLYQLLSSVGEYDVGILPHIWMENSPLVLLENFHAGKMVICSRLGGPVDWVVDPRQDADKYNGLLFPGGHEAALADCITRLVRGDVVIPSPREIHQRVTLQSYPAHVREWEGIYREVVTSRERSPRREPGVERAMTN